MSVGVMEWEGGGDLLDFGIECGSWLDGVKIGSVVEINSRDVGRDDRMLGCGSKCGEILEGL